MDLVLLLVNGFMIAQSAARVSPIQEPSLTCRVRVELKDGAKTLLAIMEKKSCHCAFDLSDRSCWRAGGYAAYASARWAKRQQNRQHRLATHGHPVVAS